MARYASHIWKPYPTSLSGGSYTGGPKKFVLHKTQGGTAAGAFSAYQDGGVPHFTWEYRTRGKWQHFDTSIAASALRNESGGVQTNRDGVIQVEIVGYSEVFRHASDDELRWIGEAIREVCQVEGIDMHNYPEFYDQTSGFTLATRTSRQRMTYAAWDSFNGVCGHQHVPENTHWDPGALNYPRMLQLIGSGPTPPPSNPLLEDDMPYMTHSPAGIWFHDGAGATWISSTKTVEELLAQNVPVLSINAHEDDGRRIVQERATNTDDLILGQEQAQTQYLAGIHTFEAAEEARAVQPDPPS